MTDKQPRFPNEPSGYREKREKLMEAEIALRSQIAQVAALRRQLPVGGPIKEDYVFDRLDGGTVRLSDMCRKQSILVYSFMFSPEMKAPCPVCVSFLDSLDGNAPHLREQVDLVVVARSPAERLATFVRDRGWRHLTVVSSSGNTYNTDYFGECDLENLGEGRLKTEQASVAPRAQMPMLNVFTRQGDGLHHFWGTEMLYADLKPATNHLDLAWPLWNLLDMTPQGRGTNWYPSLTYADTP